MGSDKVFLELPGRRVELAPGESIIGRSRRCEVAVADASISRRHASIAVAPGRITLRDLGSSNGTFVNGRRLRGSVELAHGDALLFGETEVRLAVEPAVPEPAAPTPAAPEPPIAAPAGTPALEPPFGDASPRLASPAATVALREEDIAPPPAAKPAPAEPPASGSDSPPAAPPPEPTPVETPAPAEPPAAVEPPAQGAAGAVPPPAGAPEPPAVPPPEDHLAMDDEDDTGELLPSLEALDGELALGEGPASASASASPSPAFLPPAGFWVRAAAFLIDALVVAVLAAGATLAAVGAGEPRSEITAAAGAATLVLAALIPLMGWTAWGTTPGKRLLGLYVCDMQGRVGLSFGRALLRWLGYLLSGALFGLGFLVAALNAGRRSLHDRLAGTYVGRRS